MYRAYQPLIKRDVAMKIWSFAEGTSFSRNVSQSALPANELAMTRDQSYDCASSDLLPLTGTENCPTCPKLTHCWDARF